MTGGASGNVFAILNAGKFTGNATAISAITKASTARVTTSGSEHGIATTSSPGKRVIVHDVGGMTEINNRELFAKRINATTIDLFTDSDSQQVLTPPVLEHLPVEVWMRVIIPTLMLLLS